MNKAYRILSLEAKDIFSAMHQVGKEDCEYSIRLADGSYNLRKFMNSFDWSLDAIKLAEVYEKKTRRKDFAFKVGRYQYTKNVICVTFRYAYKEYNMVGKNTFVKNGYSYRDCAFTDGVCLIGGELIGIQTNVEVQSPLSKELLGPYFEYADGFYQQVGNIPTVMDKAELRNYLYQNGFKCDGVEYVRYKRSSGSSRVGKCLFVNKALAEEMERWDCCGLDITEGQPLDLASWEAYISLPMSSIIDTMQIPMESILVIDDYESVFKDTVVAVGIEDNHLASERKEVEISNSIWDGQSIMDKSLFGAYEDKGMLLLRNRFFKSCCFNANVQQWFEDNGITSVEQLNGFTLATDISQVKFITTPSSIKYAKFGTIEEWMKNVEPTFGIVKYEKTPHPFGGRLVQAHYQLFNTLQLSYEEMEEVLSPSVEYIKAIRRDPAVLRYAIKYPVDDDDTGKYASLNSKNEVIFRLLGVNDKFARTKLYYDFRDDLIKGKIRSLRKGHVLVNGNYSTLMGNGMEMLQAAIGRFDGESVIGQGNIHSTRFPYGQELLASRSPHVTVGNILLVTNKECEAYDTYFNMTEAIVCVNAIGENIQQRLNGCDYDSDTMLITDHPLLIEVAKRNYDHFLVPTNMTTSVKTARKYTQDDKADLDVKTSVNKIGEIINLSQQLNSLMWDKMSRGATRESCADLYDDICKLAVLSNIEIDRAKREFVINSATEIDILKRKYKITDDKKTVKPMFFKMITTENGFELSDNVRYKYFNTSMDYLQKILARFNFREGRECKRDTVPFMDIIKEPPNNVRQGYYYAQRDRVIDIVRGARDKRKKLFLNYENADDATKEMIWTCAGEIKQNCIEEIEKFSGSPATMYLVLKELETPETRDVARFVFEVLFGRPNETFYSMIKESEGDIFTLEECDDGDIEYFGFRFKKANLRAKNDR